MADNFSPDDFDLMARTMIGEESSPEGQAGVANVIINRLNNPNYPKNITDVVHQRNAFEAWSSRGRQLTGISKNDPNYQQAYSIAQQVASGTLPDPTNGATRFINPRLQTMLGRKIPSWAQGDPSAIIGRQSYYTEPDAIPSGAQPTGANVPSFMTDFAIDPATAPSSKQITIPLSPANIKSGTGSFESDFEVAPAGEKTETTAAPPSVPISAPGLVRAGVSGLEQGVIGLAGLPGDISSLMRRITGTPENLIPTQGLPTSQDIQQRAEQAFGPLYQPQNPAERVVQTMGAFAPAAIGGPESLISRIGTRVAAPALASEAAGALTQGTPYEVPARIAGALGGGAIASGLANKAARQILQSPSLEELYTQKNALYGSPEISSLRFDPSAQASFSSGLKRTLLNKKIDVEAAPTVSGIIDRLANPRFGPAGTIDDFDLARQSLSGGNVPYNENRAAGIARNAIDDYLANVPQKDLIVGDAAAANEKLLQARNVTAAIKRSETISDALGRAEVAAGAAHSGFNLENVTRQQLRPILQEKLGVSKRPGFQDYTPAEINALRHAVIGTWYGNRVRQAAKLLGSGGGLGNLIAGLSGAEAAHQAGSDWLTSALVGLGTGAAGRVLGGYGATLEQRRAAILDNLLRMPLPTAQRATAQASMLAPVSRPSLALQGLLARPLNQPVAQTGQ